MEQQCVLNYIFKDFIFQLIFLKYVLSFLVCMSFSFNFSFK